MNNGSALPPIILLVVDDLLASLLHDNLLSHGYCVIRTHDEWLAADAGVPMAIDLLLGEIRSPHDARLQQIGQLRARCDRQDIPVVLIGPAPPATIPALGTNVTWIDVFATLGGILASIRACLPHPAPRPGGQAERPAFPAASLRGRRGQTRTRRR